MGKKIKDVDLVPQLAGDYKLPISDLTSNAAQGTTVSQLSEFGLTKHKMPNGKTAKENFEDNISKTTYLLHLFGQYATPDPQSLLIDPTRKDVAISSESMSEVEAQGWAISQPIVIKKGNIYRIKVGEASGQYVTTAMRYQYRDEQGNLRYAYKRKTQLDEHSELPVDGYLIMYGLPRDYELVVCFKYTADYDPVVEVLTAGLLRTLAFQLGDMQDMIDQKLDVNGHSSAASVGGAMALLQKGDVPEDTYSELLTARMIGNAPDLMHVHGGTDTRSGIDDGKDVNVVVEKVWGDAIGGNQMQKNNPDSYQFVKDGVTVTKDGNTYTVTAASGSKRIYDNQGHSIDGFKNGDALMLIVKAKAEADVPFGIHLSATNASGGLGTVVGTGDWSGYGKIYKNADTCYYCMYLRNNNAIEIEKPVILNLTTLFPTDQSFVDSLTKDDAIKVAHRLGFAAFTLD